VLTAAFPEPGEAGGERGCQGVVRIVSKAAHSTAASTLRR
jgi:hypothetical protein